MRALTVWWEGAVVGSLNLDVPARRVEFVAVALRVAPGHQSRPRRAAHGGCDVGGGEPDPGGGEPVEPRLRRAAAGT